MLKSKEKSYLLSTISLNNHINFFFFFAKAELNYLTLATEQRVHLRRIYETSALVSKDTAKLNLLTSFQQLQCKPQQSSIKSAISYKEKHISNHWWCIKDLSEKQIRSLCGNVILRLERFTCYAKLAGYIMT